MNLLAMLTGGFYPALHGSPLEPECGFDRGDRAAMRHQCQHQDDSRFRDDAPSGLVVGRILLGPASYCPTLTVESTPTSCLETADHPGQTRDNRYKPVGYAPKADRHRAGHTANTAGHHE